MRHPRSNANVKAPSDQGFGHYLRTGRRLTIGRGSGELERKFNPYHDPENGRFTFAPGGPRSRSHPGSASGRGTASKPAFPPKPALTPNAPTGVLSELHETSGRGPTTVSTGTDDPGGISYGSYQLSTNAGTVAAFITSAPARRWTAKFKGLRPGTRAFTAQWQAIAKSEPVAFKAAQTEYILRTHYYPIVARVKRATSYDLDKGHPAVREAAFSASVQHQGASLILADAIRRTDQRLKRTDPNYQYRLIDSIYQRRSEYVANLRDKAKTRGDLKTARTHNNDVTIRYPKERDAAQRMLSGH